MLKQIEYMNPKYLVMLLLLIAACNNRYNQMIEWSDGIEIGSSMEQVRRGQPEYVKVDWQKPQVFENETWYQIVEVKGSTDMQEMNNYLVFIGTKYQRRIAMK
jgi:hypothetical protein